MYQLCTTPRGKWVSTCALFVLLCQLPLFYLLIAMHDSLDANDGIVSALENVHSTSVAAQSATSWIASSLSLSSQGRLFSAQHIRKYVGVQDFVQMVDNHGLPSGNAHPRAEGQRTCDKWAVLTTIFPPSVAIRQLASLEDWCTVVVGDQKSPKSYEIDAGDDGSSAAAASAEKEGRLVYLTPKRQTALPYKIVPLLKWNHFGRKNIGFLFAIHHGARLIYDVDDDNILKNGELPVNDLHSFMNTDGQGPKQAITEVVIDQDTFVYNPYNSFVSSFKGSPIFSWPRGFPLDQIRNNNTSMKTTVSQQGRPIPGQVTVMQSLADHDPDVDAIYRLTSQLPIEFQQARPTVTSPKRPVIL
jgi:hypothetical protein